jgi:RNA polymerase sigma-70 factor (ECF subfamily)
MQEVIAVSHASHADPYDAELVAQAKARRPEAWTELYNAHYPAIFRYAKARVFDETTAEDLAANVFTAALKGIDSYHYRGRPLLAWLYRIARNVVADHQRQPLKARGLDLAQGVIGRVRRRQPRDVDRVVNRDEASTPSSDGDPATMLQSLDLRNALRKLPHSQREVVILRFFVGLSAQQVGALIGKKPAADRHRTLS